VANVMRFVILGDDRGGPAFATFTRQVERANQAVDRNNAALKRQSKTAKESRGGILSLAGTITGFGDAADAASSRGNKLKLTMAGINLATGVAEPAISALVVTVGALGSGLVAAGAGLGVFGAIAGSAVKSMGKQLQQISKLQEKLGTPGQTAAQAAAIQKQITEAQKGFDEQFGAAAKGIEHFQKAWHKLQDDSQKPVLNIIGRGLELLTAQIPKLAQFLPPVERALNHILDRLSAGFKSKGFDDFLAALAKASGPVTEHLGNALINIAIGIAGIVKAFLPMSQTVFAGLDKLTAKFAAWGQTLTSHSGFQSLVSQWKTVWPQVRQGLGSLLTILVNIGGAVAGIATPANSMALWQIANPLLAAAAGLSAHPELVRALLYLTLVGKGASQIKGVFETLKSGWGSLAKVLGLLTGGKIQLGMQSAGDTMLLASKNMQRAADTMAGAGVKGGAAGKAGGAAAGGAAAISRAALAGYAAAGAAIAAGILLKVREDLKSGFKGIIRDIPHWFNFGTLGFIAQSAQGWADLIVEHIKAPFRSGLRWIGHFIAASWDQTRHDTARIWDSIISYLAGSWRKLAGTVAAWWRTMARTISAWWSNIRAGAAQWWNSIWNTVVTKVINGVRTVGRWIGTLPGTIRRIFWSAGTWLYQAGKNVIQGLWNGLTAVWRSVTKWISGIAAWIKAHKGPVSLDRQLLYPAGHALMSGLLSGLKAGFGPVGSFVGGIASWVLGKITGAGGKLLGGKVVLDTSQFSGAALSSALGGDAAANKALARRIFPWPASMWPAFDYLEMREAGYNRFARNPSSGAYGIPQALPPTKMPFAAQAAGGSHAGAQLSWMFSYIRSVYGNPVNAAAHERAFNWYGHGGTFRAGQLIGVGDRGPELVSFNRAGRVHSPEQSAALAGGNTYNITVNVPPAVSPAAVGRTLVEYIREYERGSGKGWRS
jgi:phage-related protein